MSTHSDFKSFTDKLFLLQLKEKRIKFSLLKKKLNGINASSRAMRKLCNKMFRGFPEKYRFLKILLPIYLLLKSLVMVTNERPIACKCFK